MGYIREPKGVDFLVGPTKLTADDTQAIRAAIENYKQTDTVVMHHDEILALTANKTIPRHNKILHQVKK